MSKEPDKRHASDTFKSPSWNRIPGTSGMAKVSMNRKRPPRSENEVEIHSVQEGGNGQIWKTARIPPVHLRQEKGKSRRPSSSSHRTPSNPRRSPGSRRRPRAGPTAKWTEFPLCTCVKRGATLRRKNGSRQTAPHGRRGQHVQGVEPQEPRISDESAGHGPTKLIAKAPADQRYLG